MEGSDDPVRSGSYALLKVTAFDGDAFFVQVLAGAAGQRFALRVNASDLRLFFLRPDPHAQ